MTCRICESDHIHTCLKLPAPGITSISEFIDLETLVSHCDQCGHYFSPDLPESTAYYREAYDTVKDDEDDLVMIDEHGEPVYRIQRQRDALLSLLDLPREGHLLDFGCGHGVFLGRFLEKRPGWQGFGFEVSPRYQRPNIYLDNLPEETFDLITANYVFEHLETPVATLRNLADHLSDQGWLFLVVPDSSSNPADFLNVDHLSHFTPSSLSSLIARAGLSLTAYSDTLLPGTLLVVVEKCPVHTLDPPAPKSFPDPGQYWLEAKQSLMNYLSNSSLEPHSVAIYGAGVYGAVLHNFADLPQQTLACFIDRNPRKQGSSFLAKPVLDITQIPDTVTTMLIGVRPEDASGVAELPQVAHLHCHCLPAWRTPCTI